MKSLDSLLHSLRLRSELQNRVILGEPWGVTFPPCPASVTFHFMEVGTAFLDVPGEASIRLEQGDLAIIAADTGHSVRDTLGTPPRDVTVLLDEAQMVCASGLTLRLGGDGPESSVISGNFSFDASLQHPLHRMLPPYILLRGQDGQAVEWLDTTLALLSQEAMEVRPGVKAVLDRLCDVLFIQALRGWVRSGETALGWPAAVRDAAIDGALDLMHRLPAEAWTVEKLASSVALSRSAFAEKFHRLTGDTPMEYLTNWRMYLAAQLLREGQENVAVIGQRVGYDSEAAFAKAFKRQMGMAPGAFRRQPSNF